MGTQYSVTYRRAVFPALTFMPESPSSPFKSTLYLTVATTPTLNPTQSLSIIGNPVTALKDARHYTNTPSARS